MIEITELQIKVGIEDNSKIMSYFSTKTCFDLSMEPSLRDGSNDGSQHTF